MSTVIEKAAQQLLAKLGLTTSHLDNSLGQPSPRAVSSYNISEKCRHRSFWISTA